MAGSGPGGKSLSARTRPAASTMVIRRLFWPGQAPDALAPLRRVGGERLADQPRLALQRALDVAHQVAAERALGGEQQDRHGQHQDQQRPRDEAGGELHRVRTPRSVPLNR